MFSEGFSWSLDVLLGLGCLGISSGISQFFMEKIKKNLAEFFYTFSIKNPRSGTGSGFTWNFGSGFNESRFTTLLCTK